MHRLATSFVLGYHGCSHETAEKILSGKSPFRKSTNSYDWLGDGVYFWESNPLRGIEFYKETQVRNKKSPDDAAVVGAIIDLGYCLDLSTSTGIAAVRDAYDNLAARMRDLKQALPVNHLGEDKVLRELDRFVFNFLHTFREDKGLPSFTTVRGFFLEGGEAFTGAGFKGKTHIQIAVTDKAAIKGVFRVSEEDLRPI